MAENDIGYFCGIFAQQMQTLQINSPMIAKMLNERGFQCNVRQIQRYRLGTYVPKYEMAAEICKIIQISLSHDELETLLISSREHAKEIRKPTQSRSVKTVNLNLNDIHLGDIDPQDVYEIITDRVTNLYGDSKRISEYIGALIEIDLKKKLLDSERKESENDR